MIKFIMSKKGTRAHIIDGETTWCGLPGEDVGYIPRGTRVCPFCWNAGLSQGVYTEQQLISAQEILEKGK